MTVPRQSEKAFMSAVIQFARLNGWLVFHAFDSRRSGPGWPDLALCRPPCLVLAEVKSDRGFLSPRQREWLAALGECTNLETGVWRPSDWPAIEATLGRRAA